MILTDDIMYAAAVAKDSQFEGVFFTAVLTTGIFCRPTCRARKPKRNNVEFFKTTKEAMLKGYRPCKVCKPLENLNETPEYIRELLDDLNADPSLKIKDWDLLERGVEPNKIRRWFLRHHGMTFHAYQRILRINHAVKKIQSGAAVTATAFDAGYNSLSGFQDSFKNIFGISPSHSKTQTVLDVKRLETPLGTMLAVANKEGLCLLEFTDRKMLETELKFLIKKLNASILPGENPLFEILEKQLSLYFEGKLKEFTVPISSPGTDFQKAVWAALQKIPYGSLRSYKEQAEHIGKPNAVRAVANANGMNRVAILIPCHRVIGADGSLTGYGGGIWRKNELIALESKFR